MRSLLPPVILLAATLFAGAYLAGYPVPGEGTIDSLQGAQVTDVPDDGPERLTNPNDPAFRRWVEFYIHAAVNERRTERGLNPLEFDTALRDVARNHSTDMARRGYFNHVSPDGDDPGDRYRDAGYHCLRGAGENIAYTYFDQRVRSENGDVVRHRTAKELGYGIVDQWMNSTGHRENLLSENWEREGIGVHYGENDRVYATQNFC